MIQANVAAAETLVHLGADTTVVDTRDGRTEQEKATVLSILGGKSRLGSTDAPWAPAMMPREKNRSTHSRLPTPGVHAAYVSGLVDLVIERRDATPVEQRPSLTALGPWYDVCRPGCCENVRLGFKPTVAGLQP